MADRDWNAAIEAAAKVAESEFSERGWHDYFKSAGRTIANNIRTLTRQPTTPTTGEDDVERRDRVRKDTIRRMHLWDEGDHAELFNRGWAAALAAISPTTEDAAAPKASISADGSVVAPPGYAFSFRDAPGVNASGYPNKVAVLVPAISMARPAEDAEKRELVEASANAFEALIYIFECGDDDKASKAAKEAADKLNKALASIGERS